MAEQSDEAIGMDVALGVRNELKRYGLRGMLNDAGIVRRLLLYASAAEAFAAASMADVDVLVVELSEIDHESIGHSIDLVQKCGKKVLALLDSDDKKAITNAANVRADGFLYEDELSTQLLSTALVQVKKGQVSMPARLAQDLMAQVRSATSAPTEITPRERQVLTLLVEGLSNKQIARRLTLSEHYVKRIVATVLAKLHCPNRTLAAAKALREGLVVDEARSAEPPRTSRPVTRRGTSGPPPAGDKSLF